MKGNKLVFEGIYGFCSASNGRKDAEFLAGTSCCVPCHCIHSSKCLASNRTNEPNQKAEGKNKKTHRGWRCECFRFSQECVFFVVPPEFTTDNLFVSEPPNNSKQFKLEKTGHGDVVERHPENQFAEKKKRYGKVELFNPSNHLTLGVYYPIHKLEIFGNDPFARQWMTVTYPF